MTTPLTAAYFRDNMKATGAADSFRCPVFRVLRGAHEQTPVTKNGKPLQGLAVVDHQRGDARLTVYRHCTTPFGLTPSSPFRVTPSGVTQWIPRLVLRR